jgi:hypothetical protein
MTSALLTLDLLATVLVAAAWVAAAGTVLAGRFRLGAAVLGAALLVTAARVVSSARVVQLFTERPSTRTVQAPHWLVSQPTCVPVSPRRSLRRSTRRVGASTSAL